MGKSIRIKTTPGGGDKYVSLNVEQDFDFLEVLSVKIRQEDVYRRFCADYGVVVGRVILNDGFGAPNAKVSVFIPLDEEDEDNTLITSIYPFKSVTDQNDEFVRYNLLPENKQNEFHQPVGTFPSKRKILNNDVYLDVYDKYYKFTTTTNDAGDFMLFGVPIGQQTIHFDLDLSDMDGVSLTPSDLISSGSDENNFITNTSGSFTVYKFKQSTDLDILPQIKSTDIDVSVQPFWGDTEQCQVGITRLDWKVPGEIKPTAIFFGSILAEQNLDFFIDITGTLQDQAIRYKYYNSNTFPPAVYAPELSNALITLSGVIDVYTVLPESTQSQYYRSYGFENGKYDFAIPLNNGYVRTDEIGNTIPSNTIGIGLASYGDFRFIFRPNQKVYSQGTYRVNRGYHAIPSYTTNTTINDLPKNENAPLTKFPNITTDANDNQVSGQYLDLFYNRPYVYYYRFKAGHIHTTNQQQGGFVSGQPQTIFKTNTQVSQNSFPKPFNQGDLFQKGNANYENGGKVIGSLYFPSFGYSNTSCISVGRKVAQGLTNNGDTNSICQSGDGSPGRRSALAPYYYVQFQNNNSTEIGLVDIKDLNSDYNYFNGTGSKTLQNNLPETSAGITHPTNQYRDNQFEIDNSYWYVYFGTQPGNTILNEVKQKYNV